ncbi:MAG: amidohydrolase family protein [Gemmatimonadetes bacterium]|nr:amidohydrolase family protein [Gemmatimonadota bacterium]MCY3943651.1 amidohydrolase family protein [Gemmatimonadota bacterium]
MTGVRIALAVALVGAAAATPVAAQSYAITGGTIHTLAGDPFVGTVVIRAGEIAAVGADVEVPADAQIVDATGQHVYPGMFDAASRLGLTEVGAVSVTNDHREQGAYKPHLQAATAIHPASEHIPVARANGITHTLTVPQGGRVPGQASLVVLDGWTIEEMAIDLGAAMAISYPSRRGGFGRGGGGGEGGWKAAEKRYRETVAELDEWLEAARRYDAAAAAGTTVERDLKAEAMARVARGEMPVLLAANGERDIRSAVEWASRQNLRFVIAGGREAWRIADWLAEAGVDVVLSPTQSLPSGPDEPYDEAYANPGKLHAAGVRIAFATFGSSDSRTLPYEAAQAVPYGLPRDAAIAAVTRNAAEMLGFGARLGTIEAGRIANLMITDGDPLEIRTQVTGLFILGREASLDNKHERLYERYRARPPAGGTDR